MACYVRLMDEHGHAEVESEIIQGESLMLELILMQLRLNEGLSIESFQSRTGHDPRLLFSEMLARFENEGLIARSDERIALTCTGFLQANYVIAELAGSIQTPTTATL